MSKNEKGKVLNVTHLIDKKHLCFHVLFIPLLMKYYYIFYTVEQ
jgi:hypothetical protein